MDQQTAKPVKPDFEMFYGHPYKAYCGNTDCGRLLWTGGRYNLLEAAKKRYPECPYCRTPIDWNS